MLYNALSVLEVYHKLVITICYWFFYLLTKLYLSRNCNTKLCIVLLKEVFKNSSILKFTLRKISKFHLISWWGNFVETQFLQRFGRFIRNYGNYAFPQNFHVSKLCELRQFLECQLSEIHKCDALHDLVSFVHFKKREKRP